MYNNLSFDGYFDYYFCFEKHSPFKPEDHHIGEVLNYNNDDLLDAIYT